MSELTFRYSVDYDELIAAATTDFERWLDYELAHGGVSEMRVDYKIAELVSKYVPTSPRQLLELTMQCEELLGEDISDPVFGHRIGDAYQALRIASGRFLAGELQAIWETSEDERTHAGLGPFAASDGANA